MGNCIDRQRAVSWVDNNDENWGSEEYSVIPANDNNKGKDPEVSSIGNQVPSTELKIKITKKQLEKLLDGKDLTVQEVLADLVAGGTRLKDDTGRHWMPALQSIPEMSE